GSGRWGVGIMIASMRRYSRWLIAAADLDARPMPSVPNTIASSGGIPGTASSMPTMAVNTSNATTLGLVSSRYCENSDVRGWLFNGSSRTVGLARAHCTQPLRIAAHRADAGDRAI